MAKTFTDYLDLIKKAKKAGDFDKAWKLANEGTTKLKNRFESTMMYYQISRILRKEKRYAYSLSLFGVVVAYLKGFGGESHRKHAEFLLRKVGKEGQIKSYLSLCRGNFKDIVFNIENWIKESS